MHRNCFHSNADLKREETLRNQGPKLWLYNMPGSSTELSDQSNTELEKTYFGSNYYYQSTATYENYPSFLINFFKVKYTELEV